MAGSEIGLCVFAGEGQSRGMSTEEASEPQELRSSPVSGCVILVAIIVVFGGLVVLYTVVGLYQTRKIDDFTQDEPMAIQVDEPDEATVSAALAKLGEIEKAVEEKTAIRVLFTPKDLNALIATQEMLKDFRGQTYITRISPQGIVADMAQPMRKGIFDSGSRYLNATFVFQPEIRLRTLAFKVVDIRAVEGEVPEQFVSNYAVLDFFRLDPDNEQIKKHINYIAAVYAEAGNLVVETGVKPGLEEE
ncbi:MAG: hypothetical protein HRU46_04290 [Verrucomicrobiales bacterium]|nr:hypothetical protein [Verrucomicrobiales bacterium]